MKTTVKTILTLFAFALLMILMAMLFRYQVAAEGKEWMRYDRLTGQIQTWNEDEGHWQLRKIIPFNYWD
jgi:hypothetical protein